MNQSDASDISTKMAEAYAARTDEPESTSRVYSRVHKAVFNQALEFIPDGAASAVIDNRDEQPKLVALDRDRLYVLTVGNLSNELVAAATSCRMAVVDPARSTVDCETKFTGHRSRPQRMDRETTWRFDIGGEELTISTVTAPSRDWLEPGETFAQALVAALGWTLPQPESSRPPITVLA